MSDLKLYGNIELKEVNWGVACRIGNKIYINKNLEKQDVTLYLAIFEHELTHSSRYSMEDVRLDLNNRHLKNLKGRYYRFILRNPKSWIEFLPFWFYEKRLAINPLILMFYGIFFIIVGGISFLM